MHHQPDPAYATQQGTFNKQRTYMLRRTRKEKKLLQLGQSRYAEK